MTTAILSAGPVRRPAVAGGFYPEDPVELRRLVEDLLKASSSETSATPAPKALIAPHAGYIYSGPIAASAYAHWLPQRESIKRVVLLGPSHFVPLRGLAAPSAERFATPLGQVPIDHESIRRVLELPQVQVNDAAHAREHSLEVHLPFLQVVLQDFTLTPLVVGEASAKEIGEVLARLWDGAETRVVISSDLSHYLDSETARQVDSGTARAIESLQPDDIKPHQACGHAPISGLLQAAAEHRLRSRAVDLRNSGDTAGPRDRVVGYGAFVFEETVV